MGIPNLCHKTLLKWWKSAFCNFTDDDDDDDDDDLVLVTEKLK